MAMWRCPHCGTPQAETARCWVCRRSSTSCGTCRHFRSSVAAKVGYCGLDRQRGPLSGDEIRACWESGSEPGDGLGTAQPPLIDVGTAVPHREFVEVDATGRSRSGHRERHPSDPASVGDPAAAAIGPRWSLWEDVEG